MNTCTFSGTIASEPKLRQTGGGKPVVNFAMAVENEGSNAKAFIKCVAWETLANTISAYKKGDRIAFSCRVNTRSYDDSVTGEKVYVEEFIVSEMAPF